MRHVFSIKSRIANVFMLVLVVLFFSSCGNNKKMIYLIPKDYKGWVNIVYIDTVKSDQQFRFDNGYVYMITGNPSNFRIAYDESFDNWYVADYYYYDKNGIININDKIYGETTLGSPGNGADVKEFKTSSFFIGGEAEFSKEPENPILKKYK